MKNKGIKKTFGILIAITLAAGMMTGCGEKKIEKMEQKTSVHEQKKTVKNLNRNIFMERYFPHRRFKENCNCIIWKF